MNSVRIRSNQTLMDIAIQEYGDLSAVFLIAQHNNISPTGKVIPGTEIRLPDVIVNREMQDYCKNNHVSPATGENADSGIRLRIFTEQFTKEFM